jgi:hypothetical protein
MTERLDKIELNPTQAMAAWDIADLAMGTVEQNYGTGFPHFVGGEQANLAFHAGYHTMAVPRDAFRLGQIMDFSVAELATACAAGYAHDIVQLKARGVMEQESADWLVDQMRRRELPQVMIEAGALAILGTEPIIKNGVVTGQMATELDYPSRSAERVAKSVACGDFGDMYRPMGPYLSHKFWQEIKGASPHEEPPLEDFENFVRGQIALREAYRFPLRQANRVLATHRSEVMKYYAQLLKQLEHGDITSWRQVERQDLAFSRQHS